MQLNELLEQYSIKEISSKTRIAPENLEHLHGRDWDSMRKVQALGFINIIEREYGVDLSDLKKECLEYYSDHNQGLGGENIELHFEDSHKASIINILTKVLIFVFIVALATGSWYIFVGDGESKKSDEFVNKKSGFYDSVIGVAHKLMGENNDSASNELVLDETQEKNKKVAGEVNNSAEVIPTLIDKKSNEKIKLEYAKKPQESVNKDKKPKSKSKSKDSEPLKITDVIPTISTDITENSDKSQATTQDSKSEQKTQNKVAKQENNQKAAESMDNNSDENSIVDDTSSVVSLLPEVPSLTTDKKSQKSANTTTQDEKPKAIDSASTVILEPGSKVWIGFRELRSGKRTAEVIKDSVKFDTKGSDYILATGHGVLTFKNGEGKELLKLHDGKKHFFMIAKGGVREISHEKFQQLNGSKVW